MAEIKSTSANRSLLRTAVGDLSRLATITQVLVRYGFKDVAVRSGLISHDSLPADADSDATHPGSPEDIARRFRTMLQELGPTFVKVGQILSTRPDVLPPAFIRELARLQDDADTLPFEVIRETVEESLGGPLSNFFLSVDEEPLASASMAQAHRATTLQGEPVVIKVQRPDIAAIMRSDLDLLHLFARLLETTIAEMDYYAPADIVQVLDKAISNELDFENEAGNLSTFAELFKDDPEVHIPRLYPELSTRVVLTMERIEGLRIADLTPGSPQADKLARQLLGAFFTMIFEDGNFHADPHPGNLFATHQGELALIDFGLCGFLSSEQRERLITLIIAILSGDVDSIARTLVRMGQPLGPINMAQFKSEIASIRERYLRGSLRNIDFSAFIEECIDAAQRYRIRVASDYSLLSKATVTLEGVIRSIAPDLDLMDVVGPYRRRLIESQYSVERLTRSLVTTGFQMNTLLREVPDQLGQVLMDLEAGRLQIRVGDEGARKIVMAMNRQATRLFMGLCAAALIVATPLFYAHETPGPLGIKWLTLLCAFSSVNMAFWGLTWHIVGGRERDWRIRLSTIIRLFRR